MNTAFVKSRKPCSWVPDSPLRGAPERRGYASIFLVAVLRDIPDVAVIFVRQEFSRHRDLDAVALRVGQALERDVEIDRRHDAVAELLLDQLLPGGAVDHHQLLQP